MNFEQIFKFESARVFKVWSDEARQAAQESRRNGRYDALKDLPSNTGGRYSMAVAAAIHKAMNLTDAPADDPRAAGHDSWFQGKNKEDCRNAKYYAEQALRGAGFAKDGPVRYPGKTPDMGMVQRWVNAKNGATATVDYTDFSRDHAVSVDVQHNKSTYAYKDEPWATFPADFQLRT